MLQNLICKKDLFLLNYLFFFLSTHYVFFPVYLYYKFKVNTNVKSSFWTLCSCLWLKLKLKFYISPNFFVKSEVKNWIFRNDQKTLNLFLHLPTVNRFNFNGKNVLILFFSLNFYQFLCYQIVFRFFLFFLNFSTIENFVYINALPLKFFRQFNLRQNCATVLNSNIKYL